MKIGILPHDNRRIYFCPDPGSVSYEVLRICSFLWCLHILMFIPQPSWASGTTAGTFISNFAVLKYTIGSGGPSTVTSNTVRLRIDEVIQPVLGWQDATPIAVNTPSSNAVLTFLLINRGNGAEAFGLKRKNGPAPLPSGSYTPINGSVGSIYLESGALAGFQVSGPNADLLYVPGFNDPMLEPNASIVVYVISDTPTVGFNARGDVLLGAAALTSGAAGALPGTSLTGLGQGGGFAVVGSSGAQSAATGGYITGGLALTLNKTVLKVLDPRGTSVVMPGAELTYQILANLSGSGTASGLVITDPLPIMTTYVPNSLLINGSVQTDANDGDQAKFMGATQTVSVSLGDVVAPASFVIVFRATVN
jgi:uncharacterized repeat protein (TIGR01451 family)